MSDDVWISGGGNLQVKSAVGFSEVFFVDFWLALLAEFLATMFLLFAISGSSLRWEGSPTIFQQALAAGLVTASTVQAFRSVSLPLVHANPVISLATFITADTALIRTLGSIVAQFFGAITGTGIVMALSPEHARGKLGATIPGKDVTGAQAFGVELILTFLLVLTMLASIEANKEAARRDYGTAGALGVVMTLCYLIALPITGCGVNPARSFGPAVLTNTWDQHWVYWAGPLVASLVGAVLYRVLLKDRNYYQAPDPEQDGLEEPIVH